MKFEEYYDMTPASMRSELVVNATESYFTNEFAFFKGLKPLSGVPSFKRHMGSKVYDVISTGYAGIFLVSDKLVKVLRQNKFTGWKIHKVQVFDKQNQELHGYFGFMVTGKSGPIMDELSDRIEVTTASGETIVDLKGLFFDPETYDDSDIFSPLDTAITIVSRRVKEALEDAGITNLYFERLTETIRPLI